MHRRKNSTNTLRRSAGAHREKVRPLGRIDPGRRRDGADSRTLRTEFAGNGRTGTKEIAYTRKAK